MTTDFTAMTGPELVDHYNSIVSEFFPEEPLVKRFRTKREGIVRCVEMERIKEMELEIEHVKSFEETPHEEQKESDVSITDTIREAKDETLIDRLSEDPVEAKAQLAAEFGDQEGQESFQAAQDGEDMPEEPSQEEPEEHEVNELHDEFGDPQLPAPRRTPRISKSKSKSKSKRKPKVQDEPQGDLVQLDLSDPERVVEAFKTRVGTNKHNLILLLIHQMGDVLPLSELIRGVYGSETGGTESALIMVLKGVEAAIQNLRLPLQVKREHRNKVLHVGLFATPQADSGAAQEDDREERDPRDHEWDDAAPEVSEGTE